MSNEVEDKTKNCTYYFFSDIINMKNIDPSNIKTDEKWYKRIRVYYIGHVTKIQKTKFNSFNPFNLIFSKVNGYFKEINKSKYFNVYSN